jgi:hypothetical protein
MDERLLRHVVRLILREAIREILLHEKTAAPDGPRDGEYGSYMFADQRDDVPDEPNTPQVQKIADALSLHFHGRPDTLAPWIDELIANKGDYRKFLMPPGHADKAFRTMTVSPSTFSTLFKKPTEQDMDGEVHIMPGGSIGPYGGRNFFSWTLSADIFHGLKRDWGSLFSTNWVKRKVGAEGFVVFLSARVDQNEFLLNPLAMKRAGLAEEFGYQMEVIGVGDIKLDEVSYFYFDGTTSPELESTLIDEAINAIE